MKKLTIFILAVLGLTFTISAQTFVYDEVIDGDLSTDVELRFGLGSSFVRGSSSNTISDGSDFDFFRFVLDPGTFLIRLTAEASNATTPPGTFSSPISGVVPFRPRISLSATAADNITAGIIGYNGFRAPSSFDFEIRVTVAGMPIETAIPEPATWLMMVLGFTLVGLAVKRRKSMLTA